ncbi:V-type proton ATPase subunit S1-like [Physella acuta]|uniref:V-type proton ATPase subunit S1-like n=1 Tax=Physella acuta TaxID=109671 RepID=UPI0027DAE507|nr:V-type proton ATPase subunit S1-like [Physella acuta]
MLHYAFAIVILCNVASSTASTVPALLWSSEKSTSNLPEVKVHEAVSSEDFHSLFLEPFLKSKTESAVVFLQSKLHVDDFTKYADVYSVESDGGSFKHTKRLMEDNFSLEVPHVLDPNLAVEKLKSSYEGIVYTASCLQDVENLNLDDQKPFLLIIQLSPINKDDQESTISQNDESIGAIIDHLEKRNIKYSALFTGLSQGDDLKADADVHANRHLLETAVPSANGTFMNASNGQIYVYLREAYFCLMNSSDSKNCALNFTMLPTELTADKSTRDNNTATVVLDFPKAGDGSMYNLQVIFSVQNHPDRWVITSVALNLTSEHEKGFNSSLENATLSSGTMDFTLPFPYSFHCTDMVMYIDALHDKSVAAYKGSYVGLKGFQMQPFNLQGNYFFHPQDCVPYFTTPIWMFLFSSAFLLAILYFGVIMILNLSIMDRYDDPKGKTITVNQGAE